MKWLWDRYFLTTILVVWGITLTTVITVKVFFDPVEIPGGTTGAFATLFGLPTLVFGLFQWRKEFAAKEKQAEFERDQKEKDDVD